VSFETPDDATGCALAIQHSFDEHRRAQGFAPLIHIGRHGPRATRQGSDWSGAGVHIAAKIGAIAERAEILVSTPDAHDGWRWLGQLSARLVRLRGTQSRARPQRPTGGNTKGFWALA
jgi:class 3 adenylate cyclase